MKKIYMVPQSEVTIITVESHLMDGSITETESGVVVNGFDETEYEGEGASRRNSIWDDEG